MKNSNLQSLAKAYSRSARIKDLSKILTLLDSPYALTVKEFLLERKPFTLDGPNPNSYSSAADFLTDSQAYALVCKNNVLVSPSMMKPCDVALDKFYDGELSCLLTNQKFKRKDFSFKERSMLERARQYCLTILGDLAEPKPDFGPGSTLFQRGISTNIISKLSALPEVMPKAYEAVVKDILHYMPHYSISCGMVIRDRTSVRLGPRLATLVTGSEFLTVPKNYKTDRPIAIEPSGQMLMQKGYGNSIRTRLRQFGYDLDSASDLHGVLAREGSINGKYATIDLASASDTICYEFVKFMLPELWFNKLDLIRSTHINIGSHRKKLEKFSSMGNGYTFELESLLFLCLVLASREEVGMQNTRISIFGDDIICHPEVGKELIPLLNVAGFSINTDKTYLSGPFRESCGHDYFLGQRVTPVYFKEKDYDNITSIYYYLNRVTALASAYNFGIGYSGRFRVVWESILSRLDKSVRFGGPAYLGDIVIQGYQERRNHHGRIAVLARKSRYFKRFSTADHMLACAIYGVPSSGVIPRSSKYTVVTQWLRADYYPHEVHWFKET